MWTDKIWLTLESSSCCNYKCPHCSQENFKLKNKSFIKKDLFFSIIDEIVDSRLKISNLNPFFRGEPLMHPDFPEFMDYIMKKNREFQFLDFVCIHTNGFFLTRENIKAILNISRQDNLIHPNNIFISIDATEQDTYRKMKGFDGLEVVDQNIIELLKMRNEINIFGPNIIFQFIINKMNVEEVLPFYEKYKYILNKYSEKTYEIKYTEDNLPWEVRTDTIYYRNMEGTPKFMDKNRQYFEAGLKTIKKVCIIK